MNTPKGFEIEITFKEKEVRKIIEKVFPESDSIITYRTLSIILDDLSCIRVELFQTNCGKLYALLQRDGKSRKYDKELETTELDLEKFLVTCRDTLSELKGGK